MSNSLRLAGRSEPGDLTSIFVGECTGGWVGLYLVRAVHKFEFRLIRNKKPKKWRPVERNSRSNINSFFDRIYLFSPTTAANVKGLQPLCAGQMHSLE
jgi:hypothetical protein